MNPLTNRDELNQWRLTIEQMSDIELEQLLLSCLRQDKYRMAALNTLERLHLPQSWIAAGFIRNMVWDRLHGLQSELNDIDVVYFDPRQRSKDIDQQYERQLSALMPANWSVKNQARMHIKHQHSAYRSISEAMSYWPEQQTAIAVQLHQGQLQLLNQRCLRSLLALQLTPNPNAAFETFQQRISSKNWLIRYQFLSL